MSDAQHVLAVDFGTANTYFCKFLQAPDGQKIRTIDFGNDQLGSISTTILYREGKPPVIGNTAEWTWLEAAAADRRKFTIRTHFKPDIVHSESARDDAVQFLRTVSENTRSRNIDIGPDSHQIIFGMPGEAGEDYRQTLRDIARDAGFGEVRLVAEPVGAMLYHLWNRDLKPVETQRGVLVIDFGGGTCDFAYMQRLEVYRAWGDMQLGGRLFDDLFFQWFLEQNKGVLRKLQRNNDSDYVHWFECRRAKEFFSEAMALNRDEIVRVKMGQGRDYGTLQNLTWDGFLRRARNYRPHDSFLTYLQQRNITGGKLLSGDSLDLLDWFRGTLLSGLAAAQIAKSDIEKVILTGGSSQWPFVVDIVCETLQIKSDRLLSSENPKAAISEGLVVLPSLQQQFRQASVTLREGIDDFFRSSLEPQIDKKIEQAIEDILEGISTQLYDEKISPILHAYRNNGGSIASVKDKVKAITYTFEPLLNSIVRDKLSELNQYLPQAIHRSVAEWFKENGINYFGDPLTSQHSEYQGPGSSADPGSVTRLYDEMMNVVGGFVIAISAAIVAAISGGGGTALIMSGPVGWVLGAILTVVLGFLTLEYGKEQAREIVESIDLPAGAIKLILWESKIDNIIRDGRSKLQAELYQEIRRVLDAPLKDIHQQIRANIDREINSLTLINKL